MKAVTHPRWLTAFLDLPAADFERDVTFWSTIADATPSPRRDAGRFLTLLPNAGDATLRMQLLDHGPAGVHLDLHVDDVGAAATAAVQLGAEIVAEPGHVVLRSPAGLGFCLVQHHGERTPAGPGGPGPHSHRIDQVSIDVPATAFDREVDFWAHLTGRSRQPAVLDEFAVLPGSEPGALRLLVQRLGPDDPGHNTPNHNTPAPHDPGHNTHVNAADSPPPRAHLDLAAGDHNDEVADVHAGLGAERLRNHHYWIVMRSPGGLTYCLTRRDPRTGGLPR